MNTIITNGSSKVVIKHVKYKLNYQNIYLDRTPGAFSVCEYWSTGTMPGIAVAAS